MLNRFLVKNGINNNNKTIINVADPVNAQDAATKNFSTNASNLASGTIPALVFPALTGDATTTAGSLAVTLANSGVTAGTYGTTTQVGSFIVDAKGRITSASQISITPAFSNITGLPTTLQGYGITSGSLTGDLTVGGNLVVNGTTYTVNSTTVTFDDIVLTLGGDTAPATNDAKDRGIEFRWHNGTTAKLGFFGYQASSGKFTFIPDATETSGVYSGSAGSIVANISGSATSLATGKTISLTGDVTYTSGSFDGTANVTGVATLANSGVTAGTYNSVTVDAKGRVTAGSSPTTLAGYGITDAQAKDSKLTSISALSGSSTGLVKLTNGVASLDSSAYLTANQTITVSGDATGSGTTSIALTLANSGVTAGTYNSVTVDAKGRVTAGTSTTALTLSNGVIDSGTSTLATTTQTALDSISATTYRSVRYVIQATSASTYHTTEVTIVHDGTTAYVNEYGMVYTSSSLFTVDADITAGNLRLLVTPASATSTIFKFIKQVMNA